MAKYILDDVPYYIRSWIQPTDGRRAWAIHIEPGWSSNADRWFYAYPTSRQIQAELKRLLKSGSNVQKMAEFG